MFNLLMHYDIYERHHVAARMLRSRNAATVLDVGGNRDVLKRFLDADILTLNVDGSGEMGYDGRTIPFGDGRFDAVASLDTIEHLPPADRRGFLAECLRVARRNLVISAPFGSEEHRACERRIDELFTRTHGEPFAYLNQHVRYGIPDQDDIVRLFEKLPVKNVTSYFAGDFVWQCRNFERQIKYPRRSWLQWYADITSRALFHRIRLRTSPYARANRVFIIAEKRD